MDTEQLDLDFGHEPPLTAPTARLATGRRALRRRRLALGAAAATGTTALAGAAWVVLPTMVPAAEQHPYAADPGPRIVTDLPVVAPDDCLGLVCVELVPHGSEPRWPTKPGGDMAIGFRDGTLVKYWPEVEVVKAVVDPTGSGATETAAVEVRFRGERFLVALGSGFGYRVEQEDEGEDLGTLEQWFDQQQRLPDPGCAISGAAPVDDIRAFDPGPEKCWVTVDEHGTVVADGGATLQRTFTPELPSGTVPPGVDVTGVEFTVRGVEATGVVRRVGDGEFLSTLLVRNQDLPKGMTPEEWVVDFADDMSPVGIPDHDWLDPAYAMQWWDPKTGDFVVPEGVTVVRKVDDPLRREMPGAIDSAGLVFEFNGVRYWALTEFDQLAADNDDARTGGITTTAAEGAVEGEKRPQDFDAWLASTVEDRLAMLDHEASE